MALPITPKSFDEKSICLLRYIYENVGKNLETFTFSSTKNYSICFADTPDEFRRIMDLLEEKNLIRWSKKIPYLGGEIDYMDTKLTTGGIAEVEKDLPRVPMIGLVNQDISTGNKDIDDKVNYAKNLFFQEPTTADKMRSACENLAFVLEPLREDLKKYFILRDVNDFFQIVNTFDIRHNKEHTKSITHIEQFEWIFYSLLNTINAYTKLKQRLEKQGGTEV